MLNQFVKPNPYEGHKFEKELTISAEIIALREELDGEMPVSGMGSYVKHKDYPSRLKAILTKHYSEDEMKAGRRLVIEYGIPAVKMGADLDRLIARHTNCNTLITLLRKDRQEKRGDIPTAKKTAAKAEKSVGIDQIIDCLEQYTLGDIRRLRSAIDAALRG